MNTIIVSGSSPIIVGSRVMHDFSENIGTVVDIRKDGDGYDYEVRWDEGGIDWYQLKVLELPTTDTNERKGE